MRKQPPGSIRQFGCSGRLLCADAVEPALRAGAFRSRPQKRDSGRPGIDCFDCCKGRRGRFAPSPLPDAPGKVHGGENGQPGVPLCSTVGRPPCRCFQGAGGHPVAQDPRAPGPEGGPGGNGQKLPGADSLARRPLKPQALPGMALPRLYISRGPPSNPADPQRSCRR